MSARVTAIKENRMHFLWAGACLFACLATAAPTPVSAHEETGRHRVAFQVEAVREVANDWAVARLSANAEHKDPAVAARDVNRRMAAAIARAKDVAGIDVASGAYTTHPVHEDRRIARWRAQQEVRLSTSDVEALSGLVGELQASGLTLSGISFSVAAGTRRAIQDELIDDALGRFQARAGRVAKAMGRSGWSLVGLSIGNNGAPPPQLRAGRMMSMAEAAPAFEGGESEVRVTVDGTIELE